MHKREIFKKIGGILGELNDQYQYLSQNPESLNELELELFLANSSFLADHIEILRKLNHIPVPAAMEATPADVVSEAAEPVVVPVTDFPLPSPVSSMPSFNGEEGHEDSFDFERKPVGDLFDRELTPQEQDIINSKAENHRVAELPTSADLQAEGTVAQDHTAIPAVQLKERAVQFHRVSEEVPLTPKVTINDLISPQSSATVGSRFQNNSVSDLKSIISLNDKLLFIKDLFNGYSLAYSEAIELVNRYDNLESADNFLKHNYAVKNKWENKPHTVEKFYEILSRRFN